MHALFAFFDNKKEMSRYSTPFSLLCYLGGETLEPLLFGEGLQGTWLPRKSCTLQGRELWREALLSFKGKSKKATLNLSVLVCSAMKKDRA